MTLFLCYKSNIISWFGLTEAKKLKFSLKYTGNDIPPSNFIKWPVLSINSFKTKQKRTQNFKS